MSCKTPFPEEQWETIKRDLSHRTCPKCGHIGLIGDDAVMPFDKALASTWHCHHCHEEIIFVVSPEGETWMMT